MFLSNLCKSCYCGSWVYYICSVFTLVCLLQFKTILIIIQLHVVCITLIYNILVLRFFKSLKVLVRASITGSQNVLLLWLCSLLHLTGWKPESRKPSTDLELVWTVHESRLCTYTGNVTSHNTCLKSDCGVFLLLHQSLLDWCCFSIL